MSPPGLAVLVLMPLVLSACGSGSTSRPLPPTPTADTPLQITRDNAPSAIASGASAANRMLQIFGVAMLGFKEVTGLESLEYRTECGNGYWRVTRDDADAGQTISSSDTVRSELEQCNFSLLGGTASGVLNMAIDSLQILQSTDLIIDGNLLIDNLVLEAGDQTQTINGEVAFRYTSSRLRETLRLSPYQGALFARDQEAGTDTVADFEILRRTDRQTNSMTVSATLDLRSEALTGRISCELPETSGRAGQEPDSGSFLCEGRSSAAKWDFTAQGEKGLFFDSNGDGQFHPVAYPGTWIDLVGWGMFVWEIADEFSFNLFQRPVPRVRALRSMAITDIVVERSGERIFVANSAGLHIISGVDGAAVESVELGGRPYVLAISEADGKLYIGYDDVGEIQSYDLNDGLLEGSFSLGTDASYGTLFANDIQPLAGQPGVIAVSLRAKNRIPSHAGVVVFDNGVARPERTQAHTGSPRLLQTPDGKLIGYNNSSSEGGLRELDVDGAGVREAVVLTGLMQDFSRDFGALGNYILGGDGSVVDMRTRTLVSRLRVRPHWQAWVTAAGDTRAYTYDYEGNLTVWRTDEFSALARLRSPLASNDITRIVVAQPFVVLANETEMAIVSKSEMERLSIAPCPTKRLSDLYPETEALFIECPFSAAIYDASRHKIYAGVAAEGGALGHAVLQIDPEVAEIEHVFSIGAHPADLELTSGGGSLLVALGTSNAVAEIDLNTHETDLVVAGLRTVNGELDFAEKLSAAPGDPASIIAGMSNSSSLRLFQNGQPAPLERRRTISNARFSETDAGIAYGLRYGTLEIYAIDGNGVTIDSEIDGLVSGERFAIADKVLYTTDGHALDLRSLRLNWNAGRQTARVDIDQANGTAFYLQVESESLVHANDLVSGESIANGVGLPGSLWLDEPVALLAGLPEHLAIVGTAKLVLIPKSEIIAEN